MGDLFYILYSTLLHLPPLRFHYADGCWDRTRGPLQVVNWQSDALTTRLDLIRARLDLIRTIILDLIREYNLLKTICKSLRQEFFKDLLPSFVGCLDRQSFMRVLNLFIYMYTECLCTYLQDPPIRLPTYC